MPNVQLPSNLPNENLYLYCELNAFPEAGGSVDYTGLKSYTIGFMKEGMGFGITNINIDISPSMQPIIDISFKDFYGNMAIEFQRNKEVIAEVGNTANANEFNYSTLFDLPYPKFNLTFKGYVGNPVTLELNVKRVDVTYQPNDGSYEIKASFVPNLYGFFADMPFYFLKAVKHLRLKGYKNEAERNKFENEYKGIFDIIEVGTTLNKQVEVVNDSTSRIESFLQAILDRSSGMFDYDFWFHGVKPFDSKGNAIENFKELNFAINGKYIEGKEFDLNGPNSSLNRNTLAAGKSSYKLVGDALLAYVSESKPVTLYPIFALSGRPPLSKIEAGTALVKERLEALRKYKNKQITSGNEEKIQQVTIKNVFNLLIKDAAYLIGLIIEAGKKGYDRNKTNRDSDERAIGKYYTLTEDSNHQQIPYESNSAEVAFVQDFIDALSKGLAEEDRRNIQNTDVPEVKPQLKKRITNLEILSDNPYYNNNSDQFIQNILARTGISAHLWFNETIQEEDVDLLVNGEYENCDEEIKRLNNGVSKQQILNFCRLVIQLFDEDGKVLNDSKSSISLNNIDELLKTEITFDKEKRKISSIFESYVAGISGVDIKTYKASKIINNGLLYFAPSTDNDLTVLVKNDSKNSTLLNGNSNKIFDGDNYLPILLEKDDIETGDFDINIFSRNNLDVNNDIDNRTVLDYSKFVENNNDFNSFPSTGITVTTRLDVNKDAKQYYRLIYSTRKPDNDSIWGLFENNNDGKRQRIFLRKLCTKIKTAFQDDEKKRTEQFQEVLKNLREKDKIIYTQFHHLCNNWKNLLNKEDVSNIADYVVKRFTNDYGDANVIYEIPLQQVQDVEGTTTENGDITNINLENAIINIKPLADSNSQTSVLNVMSNICNMNNFMFIPIPGNGLRDEGLQDLFQPYTRSVLSENIKVSNQFYVLWMPTPENRSKYNDNRPLYIPFETNLKKDVFEVNFGSVNNMIVKSVTMSTEDNKVTSESAIAVNNLTNPSNSNKFQNFDCSSLSIMEGRSYKITMEMIGNAQVIPTQFFVLNATNIFTGLYQIMKVKHSIQPNNMSTTVEAIKMKYSGSNGKFVYVPPVTLETLSVTPRKLQTTAGTVTGSNNPVVVDSTFVSKFLNDRFAYLKSKEGFREKTYVDADYFSIGYGHFLKPDKALGYLQIGSERIAMSDVFSNGLTKKQCEDLFVQDCKIREQTINTKAPRYDGLPENKKGAILSYYYNTGRLPKNLNINLNQNADTAVADSIRNGIKTVGGQYNAELDARRQDEANLYLFKV